ncbi:outer membrane protein assembly factor BamE [soil metagenome]
MKAAIAKIAIVLAGVALLAGCAGVRDHRGAVIDSELVAAVQVGVDNKESVQRTLGRPSFVSQFAPTDWYYVSRDTNTFAFRNPRVTDQTVLRVRFDQAGNVVSVDKTGREQIASINPVNDKTPTAGRQRSLLEDIFGNIGTVNSAATPPTP